MAESPSELQFEIDKLERKHAENPEGRFFVPLANAYRKMGDVETAEALLRTGVERHPEYLSAHIVLGRCLADRGAVREAEDEFRFVLSQDSQNLIALRTLGELAVADGRAGEAAEWYRELLAVDPMNEDARQVLDSLSDAPASAEQESEFRSGAGWWDAGAETGDDASQTDPASEVEDLASADPVSYGDIEVAAVSSSDSDASAEAEEPSPVDDLSSWAGYDDLPGLRADAQPEAGWIEHSGPDEDGGSDAAAGDDVTAWGGPIDRSVDESSEGFDRLPTLEPFAPSFSSDSDSDDDSSEPEEEAPEPHQFATGGSSEVVTETIAELYARQGLHERAAAVYRELIRRRGGDPALEQRLLEIERTGRNEETDDLPALTLEDDEARVSPVLDAEDDPFAASFEVGFTTADADPRATESAEATVPDAGIAAAGGTDGESSIVRYLSGLATWRPTSASASAEAPAVAGDPPEEFADESGGVAVESDTGPSNLNLEESSLGDRDLEEEPWSTSGRDPAAGFDTAAWEPTEPDGSDDLPYLNEVVESAADAGTGSAEDEPFPWELPGRESLGEASAEAEPRAASIERFFGDDAEPVRPRGEEKLSESVAPQLPEARELAGPPADSDPNEDEDLESFQAWLRSLKR